MRIKVQEMSLGVIEEQSPGWCRVFSVLSNIHHTRSDSFKLVLTSHTKIISSLAGILTYKSLLSSAVSSFIGE